MSHDGQIRASRGLICPILPLLSGYRGQIRGHSLNHGQIRGRNASLPEQIRGAVTYNRCSVGKRPPILSMISAYPGPNLSMNDVESTAEPYSVHDKRSFRPLLSY